MALRYHGDAIDGKQSVKKCDQEEKTINDVAKVVPAVPQQEKAMKRYRRERFFNPKWGWIRLYEEQLQALFFVVFTGLFVLDAKFNALGSTNGKFVSLVDTIYNVYSFRVGLPKREGNVTVLRFLWVCVVSFVLKFAAQTLVSIILGEAPVIFKGYRHLYSFFVGFCLVWFSPSDMVYKNIKRSSAVKLLIVVSCGLYKLRKALFAAETVSKVGGSLGFAFVVLFISLDGNTLMRKFFLFWEKLLVENQRNPRPLKDVAIHMVKTCFTSLLSMLSESLLPNFVVIFLLWTMDDHILENQFVELRIVLLIYFAWKQGAFSILASIHSMTFRQNSDSPVNSNNNNKPKTKTN